MFDFLKKFKAGDRVILVETNNMLLKYLEGRNFFYPKNVQAGEKVHFHSWDDSDEGIATSRLQKLKFGGNLVTFFTKNSYYTFKKVA